MANPEHVEIVLHGRDAIDQWRDAHNGEILNLSEANLSRANLTRANLSRSNLSRANLTSAGVFGTDLAGANLSGANLSSAELSGAKLFNSILTGADLTGATLLAAVFSNTALDQAQFLNSITGFTVFANCDLSAALELETVQHYFPSTIGLDTIIMSGGNIPEVFLRGAGVPDNIITYVRSLVAEPIQFYTCFISYAHQDQAFAARLHADLQAKGVRCWYYPESAIMGRRIWEDVDRSIRVYDKLVVICSEASLNSPAVVDEVERALDKEAAIARDNAQRRIDTAAKGEEPRLRDPDVLFPIRIDDFILDGWKHYRKHDVTSRNVGDFVGWDKDVQKYQDSLDRLLHALDPKSWPGVG